MAAITQEVKLRRRQAVESVLGTHALEGLYADAATLSLFHQYEAGELTPKQLASALDDHAMRLVAAHQTMAGVA